MTTVAGIEIEKNAKGQDAFIRIDLKKYGKKLQPFLQEIGVVEDDFTLVELSAMPANKRHRNPNFEKEWAEGITREELLKSVYKHIDSLPWKK